MTSPKNLSRESSYVVDVVIFSFTISFIFFLLVCLFVLICFIFILVTATFSFYFLLPSLVLPTLYLIWLVTLLCKYKMTIATFREEYFQLISQTSKENEENQGQNYENRGHHQKLSKIKTK